MSDARIAADAALIDQARERVSSLEYIAMADRVLLIDLANALARRVMAEDRAKEAEWEGLR